MLLTQDGTTQISAWLEEDWEDNCLDHGFWRFLLQGNIKHDAISGKEYSDFEKEGGRVGSFQTRDALMISIYNHYWQPGFL